MEYCNYYYYQYVKNIFIVILFKNYNFTNLSTIFQLIINTLLSTHTFYVLLVNNIISLAVMSKKIFIYIFTVLKYRKIGRFLKY